MHGWVRPYREGVRQGRTLLKRITEGVRLAASTIAAVGAATAVLWLGIEKIGPVWTAIIAASLASPLIWVIITKIADSIDTVFKVCRLVEFHLDSNGGDLETDEEKCLGLRDLMNERSRQNRERWEEHAEKHSEKDVFCASATSDLRERMKIHDPAAEPPPPSPEAAPRSAV